MELRQLATFQTLATTLNFTRAAAALDYAQSSVTAQIQALEEEFGVPLFDRIGRRVALTEAGQRLLIYANKLLELAQETRQAVIGPVSTHLTGSVAITAIETLCTYRLPVILQQFRQRYPGVQLNIKPSSWPEEPRYVSDGMVDVAFVLEQRIESKSLIVEELVQEPLMVVARPDHPLASLSRVEASQLAHETGLLTEVGCSYRNMFLRNLANAGVQLNSSLEFNSVEAIKQCVIAGMGITVLPAVAVRNEIAHGQLAEIKWAAPNFALTTQMLWHKDKWLSPALTAFLQVAREATRNAECKVTSDKLKVLSA